MFGLCWRPLRYNWHSIFRILADFRSTFALLFNFSHTFLRSAKSGIWGRRAIQSWHCKGLLCLLVYPVKPYHHICLLVLLNKNPPPSFRVAMAMLPSQSTNFRSSHDMMRKTKPEAFIFGAVLIERLSCDGNIATATQKEGGGFLFMQHTVTHIVVRDCSRLYIADILEIAFLLNNQGFEIALLAY